MPRGTLKSTAMIGILMLVALTATPVHAQVTPTATVTSAILVVKGVAVDLTITATCEPDLVYGLGVEFSQRNGRLLARGSNFAGFFPCSGTPQDTSMRISGQSLFKTGSASSITALTVCTPDLISCMSDIFDEVVRITKK